MAKITINNKPKLFLKAMKNKFVETSEPRSPVFIVENLGRSSEKTDIKGAIKGKAKRITSPLREEFDHCALCNGKLEVNTTKFMARAGGEVVIINDVPALVCEQCGEAYYTVEVSRKIDSIMSEAHQKKLCVRPVPAGEVSLNS